MTDCRKCLWYDKERDELKRSGEDVAFIGKEPPNDHYCFTYNPIEPDLWNGKRDCKQFINREE